MRDATPVELETYLASHLVADTSPQRHWDCLGPYNIAGRVTSLTIHPRHSKQWFAGAAAGGVWRSTDEGESWQPAWSPYAPQNIGALGWLSRDAKGDAYYLLAATGEANMSPDSYPGSGVFMSDDSCLTWQPLFGPSPGRKANLNEDVRTFPRRIGEIASRGQRIAFASVFLDNSLPGGLYLFDDGNFHAVEFWGRRSYNCHSVLLHPTNRNLLLASIEPDGAHNGIWRSHDFGKSWEHLTKGLPSADQFRRTSLAFAPSNPRVVYALASDRNNHVLGVFRSTNGGDTWGEILGGRFRHERQMSYNNVIAVHPENPRSIIWGGMHLYRTDDAGKNWKKITSSRGKNFVHSDHHALLWPEKNLIISGNDGGVAVSRDGGDTWNSRCPGMTTTMFYGINVAPTDCEIYAGGTQDNGILIAGIDGAKRGEMKAAISGDGAWIAFDGADALGVYACASGFRVYRHPSRNGWKYEDWRYIAPRDVTPAEIALREFTVLAIDPSTKRGAKTIWAGSTRLWRTKNNGKNWKPVSLTFDGTAISAIAISSLRDGLIFVGTTGGGIFRTIDGGRNWSQSLSSIDIPSRAITHIELHPKIRTTLVVTVASSGIRSSGVDLSNGDDLAYRHVFRSEDLGETWNDIDEGKLPNVVFYAAAYESVHPYRLFVAGDLGVWTEIKGGWLNISGNLPNVVVSDLVYHEKNSTLTAATYGRGLWRLQVSDKTSVTAQRRPRQEQIEIAMGLRVDLSLPAPTLLSPAAGAVIPDFKKTIVARVQPVVGAVGYQVELLTNVQSVPCSSKTPEIELVSMVGVRKWRAWAILPNGLRTPASPWRSIVFPESSPGFESMQSPQPKKRRT